MIALKKKEPTGGRDVAVRRRSERRNPYRAGLLMHPSQRSRPRECRDQDFLARGPSRTR